MATALALLALQVRKNTITSIFPYPHHLTQRNYLATLIMIFKDNNIRIQPQKNPNWIIVTLIIQNQQGSSLHSTKHVQQILQPQSRRMDFFCQTNFLSAVTLEETSSPQKKQEKPTLFAICFFQLSCFTQWNPLVVWRTLSLDPEQWVGYATGKVAAVAVYT